jgi:2-haloalkanoic acid dehalogenase type II
VPAYPENTRESGKASSLARYSTLTFDCYGTLIDWESGIWDALQPLLLHNRVDRIDRRAGLETFAIEETAQEAETPDMLYPDLLTRVHRRMASALDLETTGALDRDFGQSVSHWPAFADTADALRRLKKHFRLVILSNVNRAGFEASNRKLGVEFDAVYTAEDIGSYKPDPRNFEYLLTHLDRDLGVGGGEILHTAQSLHHDHQQARAFGLANAWIDRQHLRDSECWGATARVETRPQFDFYFHSMEEMADFADRAAG